MFVHKFGISLAFIIHNDKTRRSAPSAEHDRPSYWLGSEITHLLMDETSEGTMPALVVLWFT